MLAAFSTDHRPMTSLFNSKTLNKRLRGMVLKLYDFDYEIVYREGLSNGKADCLSRKAWETEQPSDNEQMKESAVVRRVEPDFRQLSKHLRPDDQEPVPAELQLALVCTLRSTRRQGRI